jgi:malate synthase
MGLNAGRWDPSSAASRVQERQGFCLADRAKVTMTAPFMRAYALHCCRSATGAARRRRRHERAVDQGIW